MAGKGAPGFAVRLLLTTLDFLKQVFIGACGSACWEAFGRVAGSLIFFMIGIVVLAFAKLVEWPGVLWICLALAGMLILACVGITRWGRLHFLRRHARGRSLPIKLANALIELSRDSNLRSPNVQRACQMLIKLFGRRLSPNEFSLEFHILRESSQELVGIPGIDINCHESIALRRYSVSPSAPICERGLAGNAFLSRKQIHEPDRSSYRPQSTYVFKVFGDLGDHSVSKHDYLCIPVLSTDDVQYVGVVTFAAVTADTFLPRDVSAAQSFVKAIRLAMTAEYRRLNPPRAQSA
ncbi:hypothetical protein NA78x_005122 [Anatilimnocola sp. NA78]|uniref:hypothetical protein n=1 Tax=Anatilimnocola sp. NA78 TaxID=3415683 RepID=UPI003CE4F1A3